MDFLRGHDFRRSGLSLADLQYLIYSTLESGMAPRYGSSLIVSCCNIASCLCFMRAAVILKTQTMTAANSERVWGGKHFRAVMHTDNTPAPVGKECCHCAL